MFIQYLNKDEKEVFYSLALDLVKVDDDFSKEEKEKIRRLSLDILEKEDYNTENLKSDLTVFENISKKKIVLTELIGLSYIDGNYCESEKKFIHDLAEKINVEKSIVNELENWSLELMNHMSKGANLINKQ